MFARGCAPLIVVPIGTGAAVLLAGYILGAVWLGGAGLAAVVWGVFSAYFLRDPERDVGEGIVAPADGVVRRIDDLDERVRISTFMNLHDVHVNRSPVSGRVVRVRRLKGGHRPAYVPHASRNSRVRYTLRSDVGRVEVVQICGLFARRISAWVRPGDTLERGERIGMIRFGSRVDLLLPKHTPRGDPVVITVREGERVLGATTSVARVRDRSGSGALEKGGDP